MMTPGGPGWNDPPSLSYETHSQTTSRKNLLTKRVGLPDLKLPETSSTSAPPLTGSEPPPLSPPTRSGPPPKASGPPPINVTSSEITGVSQFLKDASTNQGGLESDKHERDVDINPVTIFNPLGPEISNDDSSSKLREEDMSADTDLMEIDFISELKNIVDKCESGRIISRQVGQTILRKIDILEEQFRDDKLPKIVEEKIEELTKFLMVKKYDNAWDIHLSLVCDHSSNVMQWMVGVKRLISEAKKL